jgi:RimJ/RimL family protein N-acetyltransferase
MIKGENINLVPMHETAATSLQAHRNQAEIRDWCRQHTLIDEWQQKTWMKAVSESDDIKMFLVEVNDTNAQYPALERIYSMRCPTVGVCGLTDINLIHRRAEFSLYIFPEHQRKGYARDALTTLFRHGFDDWNLHSIWGETFDGNPALSLFTDKLGMTYEGTRRESYYKKGRWIDSHIVSILRSEFNERCNH